MSRPPQLVPVSLKGNEEALFIEWSDGVAHQLSWKLLRDRCPCATCRAKREAPPEPQPATLLPVMKLEEAQPVRAKAMRPVGNYAYAIHFNDGHSTGIFSLEVLRALGEETG